MSLTHPCRVRFIVGDRNCSVPFPGTERQHVQVRRAILNHFCLIEHWMLPHFSHWYPSATEYIEGTHMDRNGTWGSDIEIAHMLNTCMCMYTTQTIAVGDSTLLMGYLIPI